MDFNILECRRFIAPGSAAPLKRIVRNHEFDFYVKGGRVMNIDGVASEIHEQSVCFRRPGQVVYSFGDYDCFLLTLDFEKQTPLENYLRNTAEHIEAVFDGFPVNELPQVFSTYHGEEIFKLFSLLSCLPERNGEAAHALAEEFLFLINADGARRRFQHSSKADTAADAVFEYITENFSEPISLDELSRLAHLEKSYLVRQFRTRFSTTPIDYLISCRLNHARALLADTDLSVADIAYRCGYNSVPFFITQFKKKFSVTPGKCRAILAWHE